GFRRDLGEGGFEKGDVEERIVAEPAFAARGLENTPFDRSPEQLFPFRSDQRQGADVAGRALSLRHAGEPLEKQLIVGAVEVDAVEVRSSGEALRMDPGRSIQGIDADSRVVGEDRGT